MVPILEVRFYVTKRGAEPARTWLRGLSPADRKTIGEDIKTVQYGWPLGMPLVRKFTSGLWEIRSDVENGIARTFFTVAGADIVLLHGFIKKSPSTPKHESETARKRMKEVHHGKA